MRLNDHNSFPLNSWHALLLSCMLLVTRCSQGADGEETAQSVFTNALQRERGLQTYQAQVIFSGRNGTSSARVAWQNNSDGFQEHRHTPGATNDPIAIQNREGVWTLTYGHAIRQDYATAFDAKTDSRFMGMHVPYDTLEVAEVTSMGHALKKLTRTLSPGRLKEVEVMPQYRTHGVPAVEEVFIDPVLGLPVAVSQRTLDGSLIIALEFHGISVNAPLSEGLFSIPPDARVSVAQTPSEFAQLVSAAYTNSAEFKALLPARPQSGSGPKQILYAAACITMVALVMLSLVRLPRKQGSTR